MDLKVKIENNINEICNALYKEREIRKDIELMSGVSGEILFFFEYYRYTKDEKHLEHALFLLKELINEILPNYPFPSSIAKGYSGLGWLIYYLKNVGELDINTSEIFNALDNHLFNEMIKYLNKSNYDYLHGAIGCGFYFLKKDDSKLKTQAIEDLIRGLENIAIKSQKEIKWSHFDNTTQNIDKESYNLGLAHGNPSILNFLNEVNLDKSLNINCTNLIQKSLNFITSCEFELKESNSTSYYPYYYNSLSKTNKNRLAWCYGDLGVSCSLWKTGVNLNDVNVINKTIEILEYNSYKRSLKKNLVFDAGLCHGSSGIALIFNEFYKKTRNKSFKLASNYWTEITLSLATFDNGLAGYKAYTPNLSSKYTNNRSFLEGISGIGLSLLSQLTEKECEWKEILLIP